jgi:hypothetical protein
MNHIPVAQRYPSLGRCIFCGCTSCPRGKEHIIPYALAGDSMIFDDATCRDCEKVLNAFEQPVLRATLGNARDQLGAPSRSKRKRKQKTPTHITFPVALESASQLGKPDVIQRTVHFPAGTVPFLYFSLRLRTPFLLGGFLPEDGVELWSTIKPEFFQNNFRPGERIYLGQVNPLQYARMLAKIAYAYAVATHGASSFTPLVLRLIRGETQTFREWVGGIYELEPAIDKLYVIQWRHERVRSGLYLTVRLRLWPSLGTPTHEIVVGRLPGS